MFWVKNHKGALVDVSKSHFIGLVKYDNIFYVKALFLLYLNNEDNQEEVYLSKFENREDAEEYLEKLLFELNNEN